MGDQRSTAGILALVALSFVLGALWWSAQPDPGDAGAAGDAPGALAGGGPEGAADAPGAADSSSARAGRTPRRRAHVRTEEDVRRDAARDALVAAVATAQGTDAAANVRPMILPGETPGAPTDWKPAEVRLSTPHTSAAATSLLARPGGRARGARFVNPVGDGDGLRPWDGLGYAGGYAPMGGELEAATDPRRHGLRADYFDFLAGGLESVPDLAALPPTLTRVDPSVDFATDASFALPFEPETFGALWRGKLVIETAGEYEFTAGSDDGVRVTIAGTKVLEFTTLRPYAETGGTIHLEPGRHAIEVAFYENEVFASCRLFWKQPGGVREVVPPRAFEPPDEIAAVDPPRVWTLDPLHAGLGDEVTIEGAGFSATPGLNRVTFAGVPAEIVSASPDVLVVKVPVGASTGPLVVQVGPLSTRPVRFEIDTLLGLYGEYFLIGTDIADLPDFDAIAPYFVRLDGPLAFVEDDLWQMPYDPDVFAARWFGYLYVPAEDEYEITLLSDDGAYVAIDGTKVVDLPGLHPPIEESRTVALTQGFHPIEVQFFENYGLAHLQLSWRRRGEPTRTPIPRGFLFAPDALSGRAAPEVTSLEPATARAGDEIVVHGTGFGNDARVVRVEFPGEVWARPAFAADDLLRVRVPWGADSGDLQVHVGVRPSAVVPFKLGEEVGLRGDYFELSPGEADSAAALPDLLSSRSPTVTRVDRRFRFGSAAAWDLPFAGRDFAVRWTGTIQVEIAQNLIVALQSESAALLRVDGADVIADVHPHTLQESYGAGRLTRGVHPVELYSLHRAGGAPRLHLFVSPLGRADHVEIPPSWLRPR